MTVLQNVFVSQEYVTLKKQKWANTSTLNVDPLRVDSKWNITFVHVIYLPDDLYFFLVLSENCKGCRSYDMPTIKIKILPNILSALKYVPVKYICSSRKRNCSIASGDVVQTRKCHSDANSTPVTIATEHRCKIVCTLHPWWGTWIFQKLNAVNIKKLFILCVLY